MNKMRLYNGEEVEGFTLADVPEVKNEFEDEGMSGISPRYVINRLSSTLSEDGATCITPIDAIRAVKSGFGSNPKLEG